MNSLSGVNASGPLMTRLTRASAIAGHAPDRALHDRLEAGHVGRQQLAVEVGRDAVERPRRRVALVAAHAQPADLLAEVDEVVRVAQLRQAGVDAVERLGEQVLVGHRDDRHGDADHAARSPGANMPAGVDDDVGRDVRCARPRCSTVTPVTRPRVRRRSPTTRVWVRIVAPRWRAPAASAWASPDGSSQPSVGSQTPPRTPSVDISGKRSCASLRRDELHRQPERLGPAGLALELLHPRRRRGQADRADLVPDGSTPVSSSSRRYRSAPYIIILVSVTEPRSWPTSPALWNVEPLVSSARSTSTMSRPAALGQVVGDRRPADAAADDHRPGVSPSRRERIGSLGALAVQPAHPTRLTSARCDRGTDALPRTGARASQSGRLRAR